MRIRTILTFLLMVLYCSTSLFSQQQWVLDSLSVSYNPDISFLETFQEKYIYDVNQNVEELHHTRFSIFNQFHEEELKETTEFKDGRKEEKQTLLNAEGKIDTIIIRKFDYDGSLLSLEIKAYTYNNGKLTKWTRIVNDEIVELRIYENEQVIYVEYSEAGEIGSTIDYSYNEKGLLERYYFFNASTFDSIIDSFFYDSQDRKILEHRYTFSYFGDELESREYRYNEQSDSIITYKYLFNEFTTGTLEVRSTMNLDSVINKYSLLEENIQNPIKAGQQVYSKVYFSHGVEYEIESHSFDENQDSILRRASRVSLIEEDDAFYGVEKKEDVYFSNGDFVYTKSTKSFYINWDSVTFVEDPNELFLYPNPIGVGQFFVLSSDLLPNASYYLVNSIGQRVQSSPEFVGTNRQEIKAPDIPGVYYLVIRDSEGKFIASNSIIVH